MNSETKAKHTPGPWHVAYYSSHEGAGGTSHYSIKHGEKTILHTPNQVATDQDQVNARIAAAAPDLLAALKCAYAALDTAENQEIPILVRLRAAIARAENAKP